MVVYLAYEIDENVLTMTQLEKIMTDHFDFNPKSSVHDFKTWLRSARKTLARFKRCHIPEIVKKHSEDNKTPLRIAACYDSLQYVKGWPLLEISFRYKDTCPHCPPDFTGLNIWAGHAGCSGIVDIWKFKPEMDRYLALQRIPHRDLSNMEP
ncbi:MAG: hypothetical protein AABX54_05745 [Nanoarchaeota archaeon]